MAYSDFTLAKVKDAFGLTLDETHNLFQGLPGVQPSTLLNQVLNEIETLYGVVTSGTSWKFLTVTKQTALLDSVEYHINQVDKILGILLQPFQLFVLATAA